jgi:hypothetical protein
MKPQDALFVAIALYALVRFVLLRTAKVLFAKSTMAFQVKKAASIAALEKLQESALIAALVFAVFLVFGWFVDSQGGATVTAVSASLHRLDTLWSVTKTVSKIAGGVFFVFVFAIAAFFWYRGMRKQVVENIGEAIRRDVQKLQDQASWDQLEPTDDMKKVLARLQQTYLAYESLGDGQVGDRAPLQRMIEQLKSEYVAMDIERRIQLTWEEETRQQPGRFAGLRQALLSRGTFARGKGLTKVLSRATSVLMFASLIGFQGGTLGEAIDKKTVELRDLQVNIAAKEAERDLDKVRTAKADGPPPTKQEQRAIRYLSREFSNSFARGWRPPSDGPDTPPAATEARAERARFVVDAQGGVRDTKPQPAVAAQESAEFDTRERNSVHDYARAASDLEYRTPSEKVFDRDFAAQGLHHEKRFQTFAAALPDDPQESAVRFTEVEDFEAEQAIGGMIDSLTDDLFTSDIAKTVAKSASEYLKKRCVAMYKTARAKYLASFLMDGDLAKAAENARATAANLLTAQVREEVARMAFTADDLTARLRNVHAAPVYDEFDTPKAEEALREMPAIARQGDEVRLANMLSGYESEFPKGSTNDFARDRILKLWRVTDTNSVATRAARALSFENLQSYSRVGGILFGREPGDKGPAPAIGLNWTAAPDGYRFRIRLAQGQTIAFGPFPAYLVGQALQYASDGRPTVLTMMNAATIGRKQVIMHPSFLNTQLGCRLMAADEWIFDYTDATGKEDGSQVRQVLNRVSSALELYKDAVRSLAKPGSSQLVPNLPEPFRLEAREGIRLLANSDLGLSAELMKAIDGCIATDGSSWNVCVGIRADGQKWAQDLPKVPPETGFVSQIRESDYSLQDGLAKVLTPPNHEDPVWPLSLTVQLTVNDQKRWEFPGFGNYGPRSVVQGLTSDGKLPQWNELRALCLLQRFFRLAFAGRLGPDFPVERLVVLSRETAGKAATCSTPRWLSEPSQDDVAALRELRVELKRYVADSPKVPGMQRELAQKCMEGLGGGKPEAALPSACVWPSLLDQTREACAEARGGGEFDFDTNAVCRTFGLAYLADLAQHQYQLRSALNAVRAEAKASGLACAKTPVAVAGGNFSMLFANR